MTATRAPTTAQSDTAWATRFVDDGEIGTRWAAAATTVLASPWADRYAHRPTRPAPRGPGLLFPSATSLCLGAGPAACWTAGANPGRSVSWPYSSGTSAIVTIGLVTRRARRAARGKLARVASAQRDRLRDTRDHRVSQTVCHSRVVLPAARTGIPAGHGNRHTYRVLCCDSVNEVLSARSQPRGEPRTGEHSG